MRGICESGCIAADSTGQARSANEKGFTKVNPQTMLAIASRGLPACLASAVLTIPQPTQASMD
jgi:hypothetical protein